MGDTSLLGWYDDLSRCAIWILVDSFPGGFIAFAAAQPPQFGGNRGRGVPPRRRPPPPTERACKARKGGGGKPARRHGHRRRGTSQRWPGRPLHRRAGGSTRAAAAAAAAGVSRRRPPQCCRPSEARPLPVGLRAPTGPQERRTFHRHRGGTGGRPRERALPASGGATRRRSPVAVQSRTERSNGLLSR